eukprot:CAMPEP_0198723718 /NCGR_PEP_ID=MMETSP1475-20131203/1244_1 /TAXON_ID= ORGANISM="Unidentified sp., Strain CCMP1999" /NCGR_SAMPLE_ID=MMETSP1475 /ASSEMBLY_ACC=CAM_ASM_001111 /LENGTH=352 /DNA_ID=CAMNT_0044484985 /DNA_START=61 /DNA_END=1120 /DNA_ORIENTATION=-
MKNEMRPVETLIQTVRQREGGGFVVRRPHISAQRFDPILLLDHLGPVTYGVREAVGAPDHPHRGQETITYMLQGEFHHLDSHGHEGTLGPGDVQWMTAGAGVVHSEMPSRTIYEQGGTIEGFQMWVNLPREAKMSPPRYQELTSSTIPTTTSDDKLVTVKVLAGKFGDVEAKINTVTPIVYFDVASASNGEVTLSPEAESLFSYIYRGEACVNEVDAKEGELVVFERQPGAVNIRGGGSGFGALLFGGKPLKEPVEWYGPFVMNTKEEIMQSMSDYQSGSLGSIPGAQSRFTQTDDANRNRDGFLDSRSVPSQRVQSHIDSPSLNYCKFGLRPQIRNAASKPCAETLRGPSL